MRTNPGAALTPSARTGSSTTPVSVPTSMPQSRRSSTPCDRRTAGESDAFPVAAQLPIGDRLVGRQPLAFRHRQDVVVHVVAEALLGDRRPSHNAIASGRFHGMRPMSVAS